MKIHISIDAIILEWEMNPFFSSGLSLRLNKPRSTANPCDVTLVKNVHKHNNEKNANQLYFVTL